MVIIIKVEVGMGKEKIEVVMMEEFIVGIYILELNLFRLIACVSRHRVYRWESKLIATYLTTL